MMATPENTIIDNRLLEMYAEGTRNAEPTEKEIIKYVSDRGYNISNLIIWYDNSQGFYRWSCEIHNKKEIRQ